ncbi:hypothetical protein [Timonella senegalensis]|nr:hypothetical protein [Timonella senegalensis]
MSTPRPDHCCGNCPELARGGYDCTCLHTSACPNYEPNPIKRWWKGRKQ